MSFPLSISSCIGSSHICVPEPNLSLGLPLKAAHDTCPLDKCDTSQPPWSPASAAHTVLYASAPGISYFRELTSKYTVADIVLPLTIGLPILQQFLNCSVLR